MSGIRDHVTPAEGLLLGDCFVAGTAVTSGAIGQLGWLFTTIGNAATIAYRTARPNGGLRITTAATADGDGTALHLFSDGLVLSPGFEFGAQINRPVELASLNWRIGLDDSVTATRPTKGVTVESDAGVLTVRTDSAANGDESLAVTGHGDLTSGTTEVVAANLRLKVVGSGRANSAGGADAASFFINGKNVGTLPCRASSTESVEPKIVVWQDAGSADAVIIDVDYFYLWIPRPAAG